ncbi:MAG: hypothetical protein WC341_15695 [Bacteroidales bacterium]|jgi:hypothetical protein
MKATTMILTAVFSLQVGVLFAGTDVVVPSTEMNSTTTLVSIAPTTPVEATFEEVVLEDQYTGLSPVTPFEADFSDAIEGTIDINVLAPKTPLFADFE